MDNVTISFNVDTDKLSDICEAYYLDFVNNFLTTKHFAAHHNISEMMVHVLLKEGKAIHDDDDNKNR